MACYKKTTSAKKPRVKVINWSKEVDKVAKPYQKKLNALSEKYNAEIAKKPLTTEQKNVIWRKKYQPKYDILFNKMSNVLDKLWLKYHVSLGDTKVKNGFKIV